jgi:2-polyprenyl-3-methyl-5-hydroxy-6-metoxy-1,4-benzoquinol methylase
MKSTIKNILRTTYYFLFKRKVKSYDFNESNPLGGDGERVDIQLNKPFNFSSLDMYQKNHFKRYEFAYEHINKGDICGDFACGTGYGSVLISQKASKVIGADLDENVINAIKERYKQYSNVEFINENLLNLKFRETFDSIISFETIEHFSEKDIIKLLRKFNKALKENGKLIFSTPYMQEKSETAEKLGFHLTFLMNEDKITKFLIECGFQLEFAKFQNYETHEILDIIDNKEFIIAVAKKHKDVM